MMRIGDWALICERVGEVEWHPVVGACEFHVPLMILGLMEGDGPTADCLELTLKRSGKLLSKADELLFGGKDAGEALLQLTEGIAVLSFLPGGVTMFGLRWISCHWGDSVGINGGRDVLYATEGMMA